MANITVYPFGTGGSLPASVGIINDLTTGGADKALSAQQGVVLKGLIDNVQLGDMQDLPSIINMDAPVYTPSSTSDVRDAFAVGYAMSNSGTTMTVNDTFRVTPYCPVEPSETYQGYWKFGTKMKFRYVTWFDKNKTYVSYTDNPGQSAVTAPSGAYFARFTMRNDEFDATDSIIKSSADYRYAEYRRDFIEAETLDYNGVHKKIDLMDGFAVSGTLAQNEMVTGKYNYSRAGLVFSAVITDSDNEDLDVLFGVGRTNYWGLWLELTPEKIIMHQHVGENGYDSTKDTATEFTHGLTLAEETTVIFESSFNAGAIKILSAGKTYFTDVDRGAYGAGPIFARNDAETSVTMKVNCFNKNVSKKVWIVGDSYLDWSYDERWLYWLKEWGYTNWHEMSLAGATTKTLLYSFKDNLKVGKPTYAILTTGMNDGSDLDTSTPRNLDYIQTFIEMCQENGVIPILSTTPTVKQKDMRGKRNWVRASGYRYIDFAAAVENPSETYPNYWYYYGTSDALLSSDNVHPTALGAKALALCALADFPELANGD